MLFETKRYKYDEKKPTYCNVGRRSEGSAVFVGNTGRKDLFRCAHYEFEDVICDIESVEMVAPEADQKSMRNEVAERLGFRAPIVLKRKIEELREETTTIYSLRFGGFRAIC